MHYVQQGLLYLHIFTGGLGLLLFWIPIFGRKGGFNHRRFGVFFRRTMLTSVISGVILALFWIIVPTMGHPELLESPRAIPYFQRFGAFLVHLGLVMYTSVMGGQWALEAKNNRDSLRTPARVAPAVLLVFTSIGSGYMGISYEQVLMMVFAPLGLMIAWGQLRFIFAKEVEPKAWLVEHLSGYIGTGIGAYTAFFAFGGRTLFSDIGAWQYAFWILPGVIGNIAVIILARKYRAHDAAKSRSARTVPMPVKKSC
tara:strand:- start:16620 stop:17384 length:765 start_codon:yes stop_codon:yes gene_type:complete